MGGEMRDRSGSSYHRITAALLVACIVALGGLGMTGPAASMGAKNTAQQMARPVIALSCPAKATQFSDALCEALFQQLHQIAPRSIVRRGQDLAPVSGSLLVELSVGAPSRTALPARLRWKSASSGGWETGPEMTLSVSDAELSASMMPRLARDLLQISALPLADAKG